MNPCIRPRLYKEGGLVVVGESPEQEDKVDFCAALSMLRPAGIICLGAGAARTMRLPTVPLRELRHRTWWVVIGSEIALVEAPEGPRIDPLAEVAIPVWVTYHQDAYKRPGKSNLFKEMQDDLARILEIWHLRVRRGGLPEDRALTNPAGHAILDLEMREKEEELVLEPDKAPTGPSSSNILVLDIETTGFLKGYKALPFDKGYILQIGWDEGDGYEHTEP